MVLQENRQEERGSRRLLVTVDSLPAGSTLHPFVSHESASSSSTGGSAAEVPASQAPLARVVPPPLSSDLPCRKGATNEELSTKEIDLQQQRRLIAQQEGDEGPAGGYFAICAAVRDQHYDLPEWIEYHRRLGASHIYVMDTGSQPPLNDVLQPYIKAGVVTHRLLTNFTELQQDLQVSTCHKFSQQFQQLIAYALCLRDYGARHRFMGFYDIDEFLVISDGSPDIPTILRDYEAYGGLVVNWRMFGGAGHKKRQDSTLLSYTSCYHKKEPENNHVKTIGNTGLMVRMDGAHHGFYAPGHYAVNTVGRRVDGPKSPTVHYGRLVLHHYVTKSEQDYQDKIERGSGMGRRKDMAYFHHVQHRSNAHCPAAADAWKRMWRKAAPGSLAAAVDFVKAKRGVTVAITLRNNTRSSTDA